MKKYLIILFVFVFQIKATSQVKLPSNLQLGIDSSKNPIDLANAYMNAGEFHYGQFNAEGYASATDYFEKARIKANETNDSNLISLAYLSLAEVYDAIGGDKLPKALEYYTIHQNSALQNKDTPIILRSYINIANVQQKMDLQGDCVQTLIKLTDLARQYNHQKMTNRASVFAAYLCGEMNLAEKTKTYFNAIDLRNDTIKNSNLSYKKYYQFVKMYLLENEGKFAQAIEAGNEALLDNANLPDSISIYFRLATYAAKAKNFQQAYTFRTNEKQLYMRLIDIEGSKNVNTKLLKSELKLKEENAELLLAQQKTQKKLNNWLVLGLFVLSLALLGILFLAIQRIRQNKILATQVNGNKVLLQEVHHRVKNNLQIVSSFMMLQQMKKETNNEELLKQLQSKIQALALIHQKLHQQTNFDKIDLQSYLESLFTETLNIHSDGRQKITFTIDTPNCDLTLDMITPLALITNELLLNSIKYVANIQTCHISIQAQQMIGTLVFKYIDNGPGLPENVSFENVNTTGLRLVKRLAKQIKSRPILQENKLGLTISFEIPT